MTRRQPAGPGKRKILKRVFKNQDGTKDSPIVGLVTGSLETLEEIDELKTICSLQEEAKKALEVLQKPFVPIDLQY
ncbi:hypothetical protein NMG60_11017905 [Bertholletia excelsa]